MADELTDFFAEIEELEAAPVAETTTTTATSVEESHHVESVLGEKRSRENGEEENEEGNRSSKLPTPLVQAVTISKPAIKSQPREIEEIAPLPIAAAHHYSAPITQQQQLKPSGLPYTSSAFFAPSSSSSSNYPPKEEAVPLPMIPRQDKVFVRHAAEETWVDNTLNDWPANDYRIFVGDLAKEVGTEHLVRHFQMYKSFAKAKVMRTKDENKARGYGFVSFLDPMDCARAIREQNGKYLLSRPMKVTKSTWQDRDIKEVKKKENKKKKMQQSLGLA